MGVRKKTRGEYFDEGRIQRCLNGAISESATKYRMDGLYVFAWESDKLIITKSGYTYEFEVKISRSDFNLCEKFYYNMVSNKQNAENWQKRYNEAKAQLKAELEAKGQEMTYDGMKFRMEQSEFWKDHYEKECVRYEREMRYNVTERRLLIQEIRKYDPTFKVDGIEQEVMKIHGIK